MLRTVLVSFWMVFLAELGDKTQLAVLAMSSRNSPWAVFLGATAALMASTLLAVVLGAALPRILPPHATRALHYAAGGLFILIGVWTIWRA